MTGTAATSFPVFAAAGCAEKQQLIVSVHDVAPTTHSAAEEIVTALGRHGVKVCSLLVVPDHHHNGRTVDDAKLVRWLRDLEADGHEIVIHGYFHERPTKHDETLRGQVLTRYYTAGEGEFYDLAYDEALRRIETAHTEFEQAGFRPRGFIAPAWLLGKEAERAAADAGMEYTTRLASIIDLRSREKIRARSLVYSVRGAWRRVASLAWNHSLSQLESSSPLLRLGIHPPDLQHPAIWEQIMRLIESLNQVRTSTTYRDWIAEWRALRIEES